MEVKFKFPKDTLQETKEFIMSIITYLEEKGVLESIDKATLRMLCENYNMFLSVTKELKVSGLTFKSDRGNLSLNPLVKLWSDSQKSCQALLDSLNITVKTRMKNKQEDENDDSPLSQFLKSS